MQQIRSILTHAGSIDQAVTHLKAVQQAVDLRAASLSWVAQLLQMMTCPEAGRLWM